MKNQKGFTLVELIIVIAVIGVLAAILIPVFANVIEKSNRSSALSDARNAVEAYIAEITEGDGATPPTLIVAAHKGSKVYTAVYEPGNKDGVRLLENADKKYSEQHGIDVCGMAIVNELESAGYITADPNQYADPNGILAGLGYDVVDGIYVEKDYVLDGNHDIDEAETTDDMNGVPVPPARTPVAIAPRYDATTETYTFTLTNGNITRNMAIPNETDPAAYGAALDFGPIIESCANHMADSNWYGHDIKIINSSGRGLNLSKIVITVPSGASNFTCAFVGVDGEGSTDFAAFRTALNNGASDTSYVKFNALSAGDNEIAATQVDFNLAAGSDVCGAFMLGYTGGGNPSGDALEAIAGTTVKMYMKD